MALSIDSRRASGEFTKVEEPGPVDLAGTHDLDPIDPRAVGREDALDAHAVADLADREARSVSSLLSSDHDSFENLDALFGALWTLANDYWQMLTEGHSAEHATSQCFGLVPAPGHLGIGATPSDPRAIRVRFNWNATRGRIVIEHCGRQFNLLAAIGTAD